MDGIGREELVNRLVNNKVTQFPITAKCISMNVSGPKAWVVLTIRVEGL